MTADEGVDGPAGEAELLALVGVLKGLRVEDGGVVRCGVDGDAAEGLEEAGLVGVLKIASCAGLALVGVVGTGGRDDLLLDLLLRSRSRSR